MIKPGRLSHLLRSFFTAGSLMRTASVLFVIAIAVIFTNSLETGELVCDRDQGECVFTKDTLLGGKKSARVPLNDVVSLKYIPASKRGSADFHLITAKQFFVHNEGNCRPTPSSNNFEMLTFLQDGKGRRAEVGYDCQQGLVVYGFLAFFAVVLWFVGGALAKEFAPSRRNRFVLRGDRGRALGEERFRQLFPELQPHLHPKSVANYVAAHLQRKIPLEGVAWKRPPGFKVETIKISFVNGEELVRLLDAVGAEVGAFTIVRFPEESSSDKRATLRFAEGQMLVLLDFDEPVVEYRHPERQFRWHGKYGFAFRDAPSAPTTNDMRVVPSSAYPERQSSSSWSPGAAEAAAIATFIAAGGAFGGAGASDGWSSWSESGTGSGSSDSWGSESLSWSSSSSESSSSSDYSSSSSDSSSSSSDSSSSSSSE